MELLSKIERYEQFLAQDPDNFNLLITLGDLYHGSGRFDRARQCFLRAGKVREDAPGIARSRLASLSMSMGRTREAAQVYEQLIIEGDSDPVLYLNLAICYFAHSAFQRARATFESLLDVVSVSRSAEFYLASIDDVEDNTELALERINRLLKAGDEIYLRAYRATLLYSLGNNTGAVEEANKILNENPNSVDAWSVLGAMWLESLDLERAKDAFDRMVRLAPGDARGVHGLGLIAMQDLRLADAISHFEESVELLPDSSMMLMSLAWAHFCNKDYSNAESVFRQVIEINSSSGEAWGGVACALVGAGQLKSAEEAAKKAARLEKDAFSTLFAKSLILKCKGRDEMATKVLAAVFEQEVRPGSERYVDLIEKDLRKKNLSLKSLSKVGDLDDR